MCGGAFKPGISNREHMYASVYQPGYTCLSSTTKNMCAGKPPYMATTPRTSCAYKPEYIWLPTPTETCVPVYIYIYICLPPHVPHMHVDGPEAGAVERMRHLNVSVDACACRGCSVAGEHHASVCQKKKHFSMVKNCQFGE